MGPARVVASLSVLEVGQRLERAIALADLVVGEALHSPGPEVLDAERAHDAAEDDRPGAGCRHRTFGQVAEQATGEAVARPGRVLLILQRVLPGAVNRPAVEQQRAVRAARRDQHLRAECLDRRGSRRRL